MSLPGAYNSLQGARPPKAVAFQTSASDTANAASYTFLTQAIGAVQSDRYVVIAVNGSGANKTASVTLDYGSGATAMTDQMGTINNPTNNIALFMVNAPTGNTTGDVVVTWSGTVNRCGIAIWKVTGITSGSILAGTSDTVNVNPSNATGTDVAGDVIICAASSQANTSFTWTNVAEDFDVAIEANTTFSGASGISAGGVIIKTATPAISTSPAGMFARW